MKNRSTLLLCLLFFGLATIALKPQQAPPYVYLQFTNTPPCYQILATTNFTNWTIYHYRAGVTSDKIISYEVPANLPFVAWKLVPTNCCYGY